MPPTQPIKAVRGTQDLLPGALAAWRFVEGTAVAVAHGFGYQEIRTPVLEPLELVERVGTATDVVQKELYRFQDSKGRWIVLRPEFTAGVVRAYFEGGLNQQPQPVRLWSLGALFRHDRPQAFRYRQFHQFNLEAIGDGAAALDAEVIEVFKSWLDGLGVRRAQLLLNSIGDQSCRPAYLRTLQDYYRPHAAELCRADQERLERNPLRLLDCKEEQCQPLKAAAPRITEHLCSDCALAFEEVKALLDGAGIEYRLDPFLVRGLDYYTRTVFEFVHDALGGQQNSIGGGGRYDGLAEALGWPATPGVGFAAGMERAVHAMTQESETVVPMAAAEILVLPDGEGLASAAARVGRLLREAGATEVDYTTRSLKAKMRAAGRSGARWAAIFNAAEAARQVVQLRDLASGEQREVGWDSLTEALS